MFSKPQKHSAEKAESKGKGNVTFRQVEARAVQRQPPIHHVTQKLKEISWGPSELADRWEAAQTDADLVVGSPSAVKVDVTVCRRQGFPHPGVEWVV